MPDLPLKGGDKEDGEDGKKEEEEEEEEEKGEQGEEEGKDGEDGKPGVVGVNIDTTPTLKASFTNATIDAGKVTVDFTLENAIQSQALLAAKT